MPDREYSPLKKRLVSTFKRDADATKEELKRYKPQKGVVDVVLPANLYSKAHQSCQHLSRLSRKYEELVNIVIDNLDDDWSAVAAYIARSWDRTLSRPYDVVPHEVGEGGE